MKYSLVDGVWFESLAPCQRVFQHPLTSHNREVWLDYSGV